MMAYRLTVLFLALLVDRLIGDPTWLWARLPHPVVLFGRAIGFVDRRFNKQNFGRRRSRLTGFIVVFSLLFGTTIVAFMLASFLPILGVAGLLIEAFLVSVMLAQKSLHDHVLAVASGLEEGGLEEGRKAVSMIVGRDPNVLDEAGVSRAAIESLAENFSDGVVAPVFWYIVAGYPGLIGYKMLNTADSMIGHKSEIYLHFGWAAARLDDFANLLPARISALLIAVGAWMAGRKGAAALSTALRDHRIHRSPNAGWPESAMAGALDLRLAGPRIYGDDKVDEPFINSRGRGDASPSDIRAGLRVYGNACGMLAIVAGAAAAFAFL